MPTISTPSEGLTATGITVPVPASTTNEPTLDQSEAVPLLSERTRHV